MLGTIAVSYPARWFVLGRRRILFSKVDYIMVRVSDMRRSVEFYRDTLGIAPKFESPGWSEFQTGATTLALHASAPPAAGSEAANQAAPAAGTCALGFSVPDLDRTYAELRERGARFAVPPTEQPQEGIRLAVCIDPDGLTISFAEPMAREATRST
jgi:catechol 2,3-dioxygenase-like lactoylglutathione lyase family enzyme